MMIWIVGGLLAVLAAVIGYFFGAIRSGISLLGTVVAAMVAGVVGGWMAGLVPTIGLTNPVWMFYVPPLFGFVVVSLVFFIVALVVHHLIQRHYRNNSDEYTYARWDRLNKRTGVAVGAALGMVWLVLIGLVAYVPGYLSTQLADDNEDSAALKFVNSLTHGAEQTGLTKILERFGPASANHYVASDILGLVYNNPALHSRLASYPPFLGMAERPEIAELAKDPEVQSMIQSRAGMVQVLEHAKVRAVLDNPEIVNELLGLDFGDLDTYLRTGVSGKFKDELILGRWRLNVRRSIAEMKMVGSSKLPAVEFNLLRKALNVYLEDMTLGFTTDNKAILKVKAKDEQKLLQTVGRATASGGGGAGGGAGAGGGGGEGGGEGQPPAPGGGLTARALVARAIPQAPPEGSGAGAMDPALRARYGLTGGGAAAQQRGQPLANTTGVMPVRVPPKAPTTTALSPIMANGEGAWSKSGDTYLVKFSHDGKDLTLEVQAKENQLVSRNEGRILVFDRI